MINTFKLKAMSILNHFGKVKTTFVPYKSKYTAEKKIYYPQQANGPSGRLDYTFAYHAENNTETTPIHVQFKHESWYKKLYPLILGVHDGLQHDNIRKFVLQDFADIIKKITDNFTSTVWATLNTSPLLTISELLWLKVHDVDSRVDHLEKMLAQVIDDNKLLQRKVDALEQQKRLRESRDSNRVLIQELD